MTSKNLLLRNFIFKKLTFFYFIILILSVVSCHNDEIIDRDITAEDHSHEGPQGFITFETLSRNIGNSSAFNANLEHLDKNIAPLQARGGDVEFVDAYIDTETIHMIEDGNMRYYTLKIINNNPEEKANTFYNLVFIQDINSGEVTSKIFQYYPEIGWLFDKSQPFDGDVKSIDNQLFTLVDLANGIHLEDGNRAATCLFTYSSWECPNGHPAPGQYGNTTCGGWWTIRSTTTTCGGTTTGGGSGTGTGTTNTIVLEVCNGFTNQGETDSEDCVEEYSVYFEPYICEDFIESSFINNWASNPGNKDAATEMVNLLINSYVLNNDGQAINCVEIDFEEVVIEDATFNETKIECIHNKMKTNPNNIYAKMFSNFNGTTGKILNLKVGNVPVGDWGITRGSNANAQNYVITVGNGIETNGSNLMKYLTLSHEMIHAYMWSDLEAAGLINFDASGLPGLTFTCGPDIPNLNALSIEDRFVAVICAMDQAQVNNGQWTHELFNSNVFEIEDYRQSLEDFLKNEYNWESESPILKNSLLQSYGANWKQVISEIWSWNGLTKTNGFATWCNQNNYPINIENGIPTTPNLVLLKGLFLSLGNKIC